MQILDWVLDKLGFVDEDEDDELDFGDGMVPQEEGEETVEKITEGLTRAPIRRADINVLDYRERELYVRDKCEQMKAATDDIEGQKQEYKHVTEQLADIDELCSLSLSQFTELERAAKKIDAIEREEEKYVRPLTKITEAQFREMERLENEIPQAIKKIRSEEDRQMTIKRDLNLLEGEKGALAYQRKEERVKARNARALLFICSFVSLLAILLLFALQVTLAFEVRLGYYIVFAFFAVSLTSVYVTYRNAQAAQLKAEKKINRAISLQNSVKIKYVNSTNLIDYYYSKYNVNNSYELNYMWEKYLEEKAARNHSEEVALKLEAARKDLMSVLRNYRLNDPATFIYQPSILTDEDVLTDVRRGLIRRRKKLKKGMDFNQYSLEMSKKEIEDLVREYPKFSREILAIVESYE
ncbi:MAG TPA: hypothetical protein DIS78_09630 [Lachnospiraceae bacterium]|nr:hypothetical protein [Lachnospiraceae bacterium]